MQENKCEEMRAPNAQAADGLLLAVPALVLVLLPLVLEEEPIPENEGWNKGVLR